MLDYHRDTPTAPAYEDDFLLWLDAQVEFLRADRFELLDKENLLEELTGMANRQRHAICSRLEVILVHLLKCQHQPGRKTSSWTATINEQRRKIFYACEASPSLRRVVAPSLERIYARAVREAARQTGLPVTEFAAVCPYTDAQLLDDDFFP
jgi:hypothetical protein